MIKKEKETGDINDPYFQMGKSIGLKAQDPLSAIDLKQRVELHRKEFLDGYIEGLRQFISERQIQLPMLINTEDIVESISLLGYSYGLNRKNPNIPTDIFGEEDKDMGEEANAFRAAINAVDNTLKAEGYTIGFLVGVARDFDLTLNQFEVPHDELSYDVFNVGLRGEPFSLAPKRDPNIKYASDFDRDLSGLFIRRAYEAGIKIWLRKQQLDIGMASEFIDSPEKLEYLKRNISGEGNN